MEWALEKLARAFPASFGTEEKVADVGLLWRELLDDHPWVTEPVLRRGVTRIAWEHKGQFVPPPAIALDFFHAAQQELRRETARALPAPAPPTDDERLQARARSEAAKEAARAMLPERLRGRRKPGWGR